MEGLILRPSIWVGFEKLNTNKGFKGCGYKMGLILVPIISVAKIVSSRVD